MSDSGSDVPTLFGDSSSFEDSPLPGRDAAPDGSTTCGDCPGCCQGTVCLRGESTDACGIYGYACVACPHGASCFKGACSIPDPNCGPSNCAGCCLDANTCSFGTAPDACGFGGADCQGCGSANDLMACVPQAGGGGSCLPTCDTTNCHGCCDGATCLLGQSESSCGAMGQACASCVSGESCILQGDGNGGICQLPCSPSSCAGCCASDVCAVGTQDLACGVGGETCVDCTPGHLRCLSGVCHP